MKKYDILEVVRLSRENPDRRFKYDTGYETGIVGCGKHGGIVMFDEDGEAFDDCITLHRGWFAQTFQEVKEPVSFIEAVNSKKKIRPEGYDKYEPLITWLGRMVQVGDGRSVARDMINGKWYIED